MVKIIRFFFILFSFVLFSHADSLKTSISYDILDVNVDYTMVLGNGNGGANESALELSLSYLNGKENTSSKYIELIQPRVRWIETKKDKNYDVGIFISLGNRSLQREKKYTWTYADIGVSMLFHEAKWDLGFEISYQKALSASFESASGYNTFIPLRYTISKTYALELAYNYNKWNLNTPNLTQTINESIKIGLIITW
ncbi:hypothetical protein JHD48_06550 [Sulfurimonas sp. SAG-AH-194-I05]|nr:hypothetical protein [Sulfurimonas sp. SAG-AH-194-I05]MDF1875388.1 hypothetical protein [Sulfurimonas sp. SAG-AH-194-I05]